MDRDARLAKEAATCLRFEKEWTAAGKGLAAPARHITRETLAECADELGFSAAEIEAAINAALTAAGTTP